LTIPVSGGWNSIIRAFSQGGYEGEQIQVVLTGYIRFVMTFMRRFWLSGIFHYQ